jgi:predicted nucleotidyltransferase
VVGVFGAAFPHRVGGCYLRGSYATGTRTTGSDLDLFVVFRAASGTGPKPAGRTG